MIGSWDPTPSSCTDLHRPRGLLGQKRGWGAGEPERVPRAGQPRESPKARSAIRLNSKDKRKPG